MSEGKLLDSSYESFEEMDLEAPVAIPKFRVNWDKMKPAIVLGMIVFLTFAALLLVAATIILRSSTSEVPPACLYPANPNPKLPQTPEPQNDAILHTKEYQFDLPNVPQSWGSRLESVQEYLQTINSIGGNLTVNFDDLQQIFFSEAMLDVTNCKVSKPHFRVRQYESNSFDSPQTIDAKDNNSDEKKVESMPFWPGTAFYDSSSQKIEENIHTCYEKYVRETRIYVEQVQDFSHCIDVVAMFPWMFSLSNDELMNSVTTGPLDYWWMGSFSGYIYADTKYEMEFALQYVSNDAMLYETEPPLNGEWSLRIYSLDDGATDLWNSNADSEARSIWLTLQETYVTDTQTDCTGSGA